MTDSDKCSIDEIRKRFDQDVERFSNLETGQTATVDAVLSLELVAQAAASSTPHAVSLLDLGCGAGNFSLRLLSENVPIKEVTLVDLSQPMLAKASERITAETGIQPVTIQSDLRDFDFGTETFDVILAGAVLHHLRSDQEWEATFKKLFQALRPGGSVWIFDLLCYNNLSIQQLMWTRYGDYLCQLQDEAYRDRVFQYIDYEDSPRPLFYQLQLLANSGFSKIDVLHSNTCFAAFGAVRD